MTSTLKRITLAEAEANLVRIEAEIVEEDSEPIDPKIRRVVIAFMAHGFPVAGSCEGHLDHQGLFPWLAFEVKTRDGSTQAYLEGLKIVRTQLDVLISFGREFYEHKEDEGSSVPFGRMLTVTGNGFSFEEDDDKIIARKLARQQKSNGSDELPSWIGYWVKATDAETLSKMPHEILEPFKEQILANRQKDMLDFAEFLISKL